MTHPAPLPDRSAPPSPAPVRPFRLPPVSSAALANGLRLRSLRRAEVGLASLVLVLDAGEIRSPAGSGGLAVLTGTALPGGTRRRTGAELAELFEGLGTGLAVRTGWDATLISLTCLGEHLDRAMALVSEVVRMPSFPDREVERARLGQLASIRERRMSPARIAADELARRVFPAGHPFRRPLAGDGDSVAALGREALAGFAASRFRPASAGLALAGDLSAAEAGELAARHLGGWEGADAGARPAPAPPPPAPRRVTIVDRPGSVQSEIRIGHAAPPRGRPDETALRVANTVLGGAFTSRLNLSLRERHGFTYGAHSRLELRREGGAFVLATAVGTAVTAPALAEAAAVLERFREEGPTGEELARAKDFLSGIFPLRMETTARIAHRLADLILFALPDDHHHTERERIRAVGVAEAAAAARRHIRPEEAAVVVVGDAGRIRAEVEGLGLGPVEVVAR